jgi:hypothetical protein
MAKELRKINQGVRVGKTLYTENGITVAGKHQEGDPFDELAKALKPAELQRLSEKGHIEGFVKAEKSDDKTKK